MSIDERPPVIQREHSLNDVRAVIPEACYERSAGRAAAALGLATLVYVAPLVGLALSHTWWITLLLWPLAGLGVSGLFVEPPGPHLCPQRRPRPGQRALNIGRGRLPGSPGSLVPLIAR